MSMNRPYFPRLNSKFTQTPNLFFDKVMCEARTLNEVRAVSLVIRKTLGWNKQFDFVSRDQFISYGISNGQLTKTFKSCIENGWLLSYRTGTQGKEQSYYFLNDPLNSRLVEGLEKGLFTVNDLKFKKEEGLICLLNSCGLSYDPDKNSEENADFNNNEEAIISGEEPVISTEPLRRPYPYGVRRHKIH